MRMENAHPLKLLRRKVFRILKIKGGMLGEGVYAWFSHLSWWSLCWDSKNSWKSICILRTRNNISDRTLTLISNIHLTTFGWITCFSFIQTWIGISKKNWVFPICSRMLDFLGFEFKFQRGVTRRNVTYLSKRCRLNQRKRKRRMLQKFEIKSLVSRNDRMNRIIWRQQHSLQNGLLTIFFDKLKTKPRSENILQKSATKA